MSKSSTKKCRDINFEDYSKYEMRCFECSRSGIKNKMFYDETEYQQHHIEEHETENDNKKNKLVCSECSKESQSWYNYAAHITIHRVHCEPPWICTMSKNDEICGKRCSTRHNLIKHLEGFHRYNVIYKKKNTVQHRKKNKSKSMKSEKNKLQNKLKQSKLTPNKLRPKMMFVASPKLTSMKRSRNQLNDDLLPKYKKQRIEIAENDDNINEQVRFLGLMYKAAIHLNQEDLNIINLPQIDYQPTYQQQQHQQQHTFIPIIQQQFPLIPTLSPISFTSSMSPDSDSLF